MGEGERPPSILWLTSYTGNTLLCALRCLRDLESQCEYTPDFFLPLSLR